MTGAGPQLALKDAPMPAKDEKTHGLTNSGNLFGICPAETYQELSTRCKDEEALSLPSAEKLGCPMPVTGKD
jgi:hypothetical protein